MTISDHKTQFGGLTIVDWSPGDTVRRPAETAFRLAISYDDSKPWADLFAQFLASPMAGFAAGIVVGMWGTESDTSAESVAKELITARDRLPNLTTLFIGDITFEENEISWIEQTDLGNVIMSYPQLRHFGSRGGNHVGYSNVAHPNLMTLVVESGGLSSSTVQEVLSSSLPSLEHLELWLGTDGYGGDSSVDDLQPLFSGRLFPRLKYLGLRDSDFADEIAVAIASSPIITRIETLDLSLGTLSDTGAEALLASAGVRSLKKLDLNHHYMSDPMMSRFRGLGPDVDVSGKADVDRAKDGTEYRYVAVSE